MGVTMKKVIIILSLLALLVYGWLFGFFSPNHDLINIVPYIATINGFPIPLDEYKLYLRTSIVQFENIGGGSEIWQTMINGVQAKEHAKDQALESIIFVKFSNLESNQYLTEYEMALARAQAEELFNTFTENEQNFFSLYTVVAVRESILLHEKNQQYLTQNYHIDNREAVFLQMFENWRQQAILEKNTQEWDRLHEVFDNR